MMRRVSQCPVFALVAFGVLAWTPTAMAQRESGRDLKILLVNDDGYRAPGLSALIEAFAPIARIVVAAPATQQSGTGHGITYRDPITVRTIEQSDTLTWYAIAARPATCVRLALESLVSETPDVVISGINSGENLGLSVWVSGTVAAAREAAFLGIPAIAISLRGGRSEDFRAAAEYVRELVDQLRAADLLQPSTLLSVNVPPGVAQGIKGVHLVRHSLDPSKQNYERRVSPRGVVYYWDNWRPVREDAEGTDIRAFELGFITITPLKVDQTDTARMEVFRGAVRR